MHEHTSLQAWRHLATKVGTTNQRGEIGLHNKPQGCSTSVALATGPNDETGSRYSKEHTAFIPNRVFKKNFNPSRSDHYTTSKYSEWFTQCHGIICYHHRYISHKTVKT